MFRYFALLWDPGQPAQQAAARMLMTRIREIDSWMEGAIGSGVHIFSCGDKHGYACRPLTPCHGVVLGALFARSPGSIDGHRLATSELGDATSRRILASGGNALLQDFWGDYVAFLIDPQRKTRNVLKDPCGTLPCHWSEISGVSIFFGSLPDFLRLGMRRVIVSPRYLIARVAHPSGGGNLPSLETIHTLVGGERLQLGASRTSRCFLWNPLELASTGDRVDFETSAARMRTAVMCSTHAWASQHRSVLHRISGGLDSSIVLSCLVSAPARPVITGITYFIPGGLSDARPWARQAVGETCRVVEHARSARFDFSCSSQLAPAATPAPWFSYVETRAPERALSRDMGATAVFNGEGGDSLFCRHAARHAAGDAARSSKTRSGFMQAVHDVAVLADTTVWRVLTEAVRASLTGRDVADDRLQQFTPQLASREARAAIDEERDGTHPWFRESRQRSLSTRLRLGSLLASRRHYDVFGENDAPHAVSPLLSQPVVEACLRIPIHVHIQGGIDRALARHAFTRDVHPAVLARTWKDRAQGYLEQVVSTNRLDLREILLEGQLVRDGLLDRAKVDQALSEAPGKRTGFLAEILDHVDTELWLASLARANSLH